MVPDSQNNNCSPHWLGTYGTYVLNYSVSKTLTLLIRYLLPLRDQNRRERKFQMSAKENLSRSILSDNEYLSLFTSLLYEWSLKVGDARIVSKNRT